MIYYLIGQPHSGKTTLARLLRQKLFHKNIIQIDGDDFRDIFQNKDYSEEGRRKNIQRAHDIALFLNAKRIDVIISLVSPYRELRNELKSITDVVEIYLHTTETRGREHYHVENYEEPIENYIDIDTTGVSETESMKELMEKIREYANK